MRFSEPSKDGVQFVWRTAGCHGPSNPETLHVVQKLGVDATSSASAWFKLKSASAPGRKQMPSRQQCSASVTTRCR